MTVVTNRASAAFVRQHHLLTFFPLARFRLAASIVRRETGVLPMLKMLRRWLGWDGASGPFDFGDLKLPPTPAARTRVEPTLSREPAGRAEPKKAAVPSQDARTPAKKDERDLLDILDNPKLTLDRPSRERPAEDGFDPYNTGAFNRSQSWERISRKR